MGGAGRGGGAWGGRRSGDGWAELATTRSDTNGRVANLLPGDLKSPAGTYRLRFDTGAYFAALGVAPFHPFVEIVFEIRDAEQYHVPLLVGPFGYTTYRGSGAAPPVSAHLEQWLNLALRWAHVITGIAWIGTSFYFNWLNGRLAPPPPERQEPGVAGELWSVHGGGFYRVGRCTGAPAALPRPL